MMSQSLLLILSLTVVALLIPEDLAASPIAANDADLIGSIGSDVGFDDSDAAEIDAEKAVFWLEKMSAALLEQSYNGTFIYMRGARFDTMEVTHQFVDGKEFEKLTNLSGPRREIIRHDDHAVCLHADAESKAPHALPRGPFTHTFNQALTQNLDNYDIGFHGIGRIANRSAVRISVSPHNRDRYGYRLWLDEETGLLLRSNLVNNGRVLELFQFTDVTIGEPLDADMLAATIDANSGFEHDLLTPTQMAQLTQPAAPTWKVNWMPSGFRQVRAPNGDGMVFTDGVATLSVFVEKRGRNTLGDMQTQIGGTVVLSKLIEGSTDQITVVGEVPFATAKRVAESVEPVIY